MANPEHLEILKQGVNVWNEWRDEHPEIIPNIRNAKLKSADLSHANFSHANLDYVDLRDANLDHAILRHAVLHGANLRRADLCYADLYDANFRGADLHRATLGYADLSYADLRSADLTGAHLYDANLNRTMLSGTKFNQASLNGATFADTDLRGAVGLESVMQVGPIKIGIRTIYRSQGKIPEAFLRCCGIPESFIVQIPALVASTEPIQFYSCFISYSSKDQDFAERLYADLQNKGVRCWFAPEHLKIGDKIRDRINESIRLRDKLLLILSENSITSEWVEHEVESALEEERQRGRTILFPIRLDDAVMESNKAWAALIRRTRHIGDFTRWKDHDSYQKAFDRLLRDLKAEEKKV
jgi:TIR domain/Pentapeptide repeats (8 copies)